MDVCSPPKLFLGLVVHWSTFFFFLNTAGDLSIIYIKKKHWSTFARFLSKRLFVVRDNDGLL